MPVTPCLTCGVLTTRCSYCRAHEPSRLNPARGSGPARARFRADTLAKTGGRCARCGSTDRVEAHHVIGLTEGGSNDAQANGVALCHDHHVEAERAREGAQRPPTSRDDGAGEPRIF